MNQDLHLQRAGEQVSQALGGAIRSPMVEAFFDEPTFTASYVVYDSVARRAALRAAWRS